MLVPFGPETPVFTLLTITPFAAIRQNRHITPNISECPGPILTYFTGLVGVLARMIIPIFVWRSLKGAVKFRQERPLLFASLIGQS